MMTMIQRRARKGAQKRPGADRTAVVPVRLSAETRHRQIVEAVLELVTERGTDDVSVQAIADRIGLTQPAVFRHFPSKEAIWLAVMAWLEERLTEIHQAAEEQSHGSTLTALRGMFAAHIAMIERHPALAKIVFSDHLRLQFPALNRRFKQLHAAYEDRIEGLVRIAKARGLVAPTVNTAEAATMFLCLIQGLGFQFAIAQRPILIRRQGERMFALFLRAIAAKM